MEDVHGIDIWNVGFPWMHDPGDGMDTILRLEDTFWESLRKGGSRR